MAGRMKPTQAELRERFHYDAVTGLLTTKTRGAGRGFRRGGKIAGHLRGDGYVHVQIGNQSYYVHCVIWCWMTGEWPERQIDHADLQRSNNRWGNLRLATPSQNAFGRGNDNPDRGIEALPGGKFRARIGGHDRRVTLGSFATREAARAAYRRAAVELYGEFALRD